MARSGGPGDEIVPGVEPADSVGLAVAAAVEGDVDTGDTYAVTREIESLSHLKSR